MGWRAKTSSRDCCGGGVVEEGGAVEEAVEGEVAVI